MGLEGVDFMMAGAGHHTEPPGWVIAPGVDGVGDFDLKVLHMFGRGRQVILWMWDRMMSGGRRAMGVAWWMDLHGHGHSVVVIHLSISSAVGYGVGQPGCLPEDIQVQQLPGTWDALGLVTRR